MKRYFYCLLFALLLTTSCGSPDDPQPHPLEGEYILKSLYSDTPVDMDFDGNYSSDWLQEFGTVSRRPMSFELLLFLDSEEDVFFEMMMVRVVRPPVQYNLDHLIRYTYGFSNYDAAYNHTIKQFQNFVFRDTDPYYEPPPAYIESMRVTENKELHLRIRHEGVFDKKDNTWKTAYLDAVFAWQRPFNR